MGLIDLKILGAILAGVFVGAAAGEAITIDAYVVYDSLFYIDAAGSIRVNF